MAELLPCRSCGVTPELVIRFPGSGLVLVWTEHACAMLAHATREAAIAEWNAANAEPDLALLALARLGAWVVRESFQDGGGFYVDFSGNDLDDEAARTGLMADGGNAYGIHLATGIREQIAALLAPDGVGEVTA